MDFARKVVLITGASSGIGAATAELFAKLNAQVVLVGRNEERLKTTEKACKAANNKANCLLLPADVTSDAAQIISNTISRLGRLDVLVNNAGILATGSILDDALDVAQFDRVLDTNLRAVFMLTKAAAPHLVRTEGNIVNVSSIAGLRAFPSYVSYAVSKAALDQFTRCIALDLAPQKVRVNAVNPGVITTGIHKRGGLSQQEYEQFLLRAKDAHALGRVGDAQEVAEAIAFLASSQAGFITGTCLPIDGGKHVMCPR